MESPAIDRTVHTVDLDSLVTQGSPRSLGEDESHIQRLIEVEGTLPPILVHRPTMRVVDGFHRVAVARRKGLAQIQTYFLDDSEDSAFIIAVRENISHGLPLPLADRRSAAQRILRTHPHWSDRAIATTTGLSAKTIATIRCSIAEDPHLNYRLGQDGRIRPTNAASARQMAAELIKANPDASLREIANQVGISPSTVRDVRSRLEAGEDLETIPNPGGQDTGYDHDDRQPSSEGVTQTEEVSKYRAKPISKGAHRPSDVSPVLASLSRDPTLRLNAEGRDLLRWLHQHVVNASDGYKIPEALPAHCVDHLIELANRCSANWASLAKQLNNRMSHTVRTPQGFQVTAASP